MDGWPQSGLPDLLGRSGEFVLRELEFGALEVDVGDAVQWNEVHVRVRYFEADDGHAYALAWDGTLELQGHVAGEDVDVAQDVVGRSK